MESFKPLILFPYYCPKQLNMFKGGVPHELNNLLFESCIVIMLLVLRDILMLEDLVENLVSSQFVSFSSTQT